MRQKGLVVPEPSGAKDQLARARAKGARSGPRESVRTRGIGAELWVAWRDCGAAAVRGFSVGQGFFLGF